MRLRRADTSPPPPLPAAAQAAGFRSVELVHVFNRGGRLVAEATGVLHRYRQTVPVSLATATRLAGAGAPLTIDSSARRGAGA